jgi:hypothetical protein
VALEPVGVYLRSLGYESLMGGGVFLGGRMMSGLLVNWLGHRCRRREAVSIVNGLSGCVEGCVTRV